MQQLEPALAARGLTIGYRSGKGQRKTVRSGIDLTLYRGELASLIGLNGAGKSTLIRTLCRFQPSFGGEISVMGKDIYRYSTHELALTVGVVLTDRTNAGGLTVRELVALGRQPHTGFFGRLDSNGKPRDLHTERAKMAINYSVEDDYLVDYDRDSHGEVKLVDCEYFTVDRIITDGTFHRECKEDSFLVVMCLVGEAVLKCDNATSIELSQGETVLVPAEITGLDIIGKATLLTVTA